MAPRRHTPKSIQLFPQPIDGAKEGPARKVNPGEDSSKPCAVLFGDLATRHSFPSGWVERFLENIQGVGISDRFFLARSPSEAKLWQQLVLI